jgi:NADH-quinone oxidoreductase subunit L
MLVPLLVLALGAVAAGFAFKGFFVGEGYGEFWRASLAEGPSNHIRHAMHELPGWVGWAPFWAMTAGTALSYLYYILAPSLPGITARLFEPVYKFLLNKWYFDELYDFLFVRPAFWLGRLLWKGGDEAIIDGLGADNVAARVLWTTGRVVKLQTGYVYHYAFAMLIGVALIVTFFMFNDIRALLGGVPR